MPRFVELSMGGQQALRCGRHAVPGTTLPLRLLHGIVFLELQRSSVQVLQAHPLPRALPYRDLRVRLSSTEVPLD